MSNGRRLRRSIAQAGNAVTDQRPGAHHYRDKQAFAGRENVYICEDCRGWIVTIDRDPGVTPMFLGCRAPKVTTSEPTCMGRMVSAGYPSGPKPPQYGPPTWEWFRPESTKGMDPAMAQHVLNGGLELREIKQRDGRPSVPCDDECDAPLCNCHHRAASDARFKVGDHVRPKHGTSRCVVLEAEQAPNGAWYLRVTDPVTPERLDWAMTVPGHQWEVYDPAMERKPMPEIVVLCGSTRFKAEFERETRRLGLEGKIVLSVSMFGHSGDLTPEQCTDGHPTKTVLDDLHKRKIDLADRVLVINPGGYIGTSTASEIAYAEHWQKPVEYLVPFRVPDCPVGVVGCNLVGPHGMDAHGPTQSPEARAADYLREGSTLASHWAAVQEDKRD